jgi:hypothetical protein
MYGYDIKPNPFVTQLDEEMLKKIVEENKEWRNERLERGSPV